MPEVSLFFINLFWLSYPLADNFLKKFKLFLEVLSMPGAHFIVYKTIVSRLKLSAVLPVSLADLLHKNIKGCLFRVKIHRKIYVLFSQDGCFNWGSKKNVTSFFFFFSSSYVHFSIYKKYLGTFNIRNQILNPWASSGCASCDLIARYPIKLENIWKITFVMLNKFYLLKKPPPCL